MGALPLTDPAPARGPLRGDWHAAALQDAIAVLRPGLCVEVQAVVDSTNTRLLERARQGDAPPCLLVAERQSAGRGRLGRRWWSPADEAAAWSGLTFSLGLPLAPPSWSGLSLAVGVALAEALDGGREPRVQLKWPNDLWLDGRKLGGVLIETVSLPRGPRPEARFAVIGVGLNVDRPPVDVGQPCAGWREAEPQASAPSLLARLAPALLAAVARFESRGFADFAAGFAARDALAGREVEVAALPATRGQADGVGDDGALRLVTPDGLRRIDAAEVSLRPVAASLSA